MFSFLFSVYHFLMEVFDINYKRPSLRRPCLVVHNGDIACHRTVDTSSIG
jgi:hypothetical protein